MAGNDRGFTLIELIVVLVLSGIIVGVIFQVMLGQTRFNRLQSAVQEVQQNARTGVELLTAEIRAVGGDGAIVRATSQSIELRVPRAWGIVCNRGAGEVKVLFPGAAVGMLRNDPEVRADSLAYRAGASWFYVGVEDVTNVRLNEATSDCTNFLSTAGLSPPSWDVSPARVFVGAAIPSGLSAPPFGGQVYVYERVNYETGTVAGLPGRWLLRNGAPVAGPIYDDGGLELQYSDMSGLPLNPNNAARRNEVGSVRVAVSAHSRAEFNGAPQESNVVTEVFLRNRN